MSDKIRRTSDRRWTALAFAVVLLSALVMAPEARAQSTSPTVGDAPNPVRIVGGDRLKRFQSCRAVALLHMRAADWRNSVLTREATHALLEQITLVMAETVNSTVSLDFDDAKRRMLYAERFFIDLREMLAAAAQSFADTPSRDRYLIDCMPFLWESLRPHIDILMSMRARLGPSDTPIWVIPDLEAPGDRR